MNSVVKPQETTIFSAEPSQYGWIVSDGAAQLGLFVSERQAIDDVKKRQRTLKKQGQRSSLEVTVIYPEKPSDRPWQRRHWSAPKLS
jgi:hypothetical protein